MKISRRGKTEILFALILVGMVTCCIFQLLSLKKQNLLLEENFNGMDQRVSDLESTVEELKR